MADLPHQHRLHPGYATALMREWQAPHTSRIEPEALVFPLFITKGCGVAPIASLPGLFRVGSEVVSSFLENLVILGLRSVLIFGVVEAEDCHLKDENASLADADDSPSILGIKAVRSSFPSLTILADVCLCPYTYHGHCQIFNTDGSVNFDKSGNRLAEIACNYARAGAHIVAPSDMQDGRVHFIKQKLFSAGISSAVMSYAAKFASCMYGPFRDAAGSAPSFGDRRSYQLPVGSSSLAKRAVDRCVNEGADFIMVKPGGQYLDIVSACKARCDVPIAVYQVSGEYAMIYHAAKAGAVDLKSAVLESLYCFRRAGADIIITYYTPQLLEWAAEL